MAEKPKTDDAELWDLLERTVTKEIQEAQEYQTKNITGERSKRWDRYYGRPYGNEKSGRSKYISKDIQEAVEWVMPRLTSTFCTGDPVIVIEIEGQDPMVGRALYEKMEQDLAYDDESSRFITDVMWMKDALISGISFCKTMWDRQFETVEKVFPRLDYEQMVMLTQDQDIEIVSHDQQPMLDGMAFVNVKANIKRLKRDGLDITPIPFWEYIWSENSKYINDDYGKGHITKMQLDKLRRINRDFKEEEGEEFFPGLEKLEDSISSARFKKNDDPLTGKELIAVCEWYDRMDVNGDGFLEDVVFWAATEYPNKDEAQTHLNSYGGTHNREGDNPGGVLLRYEINEDGFNPTSDLRCIIDPYKFEGIAYIDSIMDLAAMKTQIMRRVLENFDFTVMGRFLVDPSGNVDERALLKHTPGMIVRGKKDAVTDLSPRPFDGSSLTLLEYIDMIKENRTGLNRVNQGSDAASMNKTATGISLLQSAAQQRIGMIERTFAETGFKDRIRKCATLYQKNIRQPFTVQVNGKTVTVQPQQLQGKIKCRVNMGKEEQVGFDDAQKIERLFGFLSAMNRAYPGILGPQQVHNLASRYVKSIGFNLVSEYVIELEAFVKQLTQSAQAQQQAQQQQMQVMSQVEGAKANAESMRAQADQARAQVDLMNAQTELKKLGVDVEINRMDNVTDIEIKRMDIEQKNREAALDYRMGVLQNMVTSANANKRSTNNSAQAR